METLADIEQHFAQWYQDIVAAAELAQHGPTRGSIIIRPYGYALWENIQRILDAKIKAHGVQNAYFPLLIPQSFIEKEAKHVEGFSPELAVVTHAGGKKLEEPLVVRPTSETIIYSMFAKWITSWRDLPMKINQWANVVRWEMRPRAFLRTTEFLWQEGHTAHATQQEAREMALAMLATYVAFIADYLAIPIVQGEKSAIERFAGADTTYTMEAMMGDGKALQMGTSHMLSQTFSDAFGISFQAEDGSRRSPYCTSWAISTRLIGAIIMVHGDQTGLVLPPRIAPYQVVIVPIYKRSSDNAVLSKAKELESTLQHAGLRVIIDDDEQKTPGAKFYHWEMRGVPLRLEIGPRDLAANHIIMVSRIAIEDGKQKKTVPFDKLVSETKALLDGVQTQLLVNAKKRLESNWQQTEKLATFGPVMTEKNGFFQTGWCGSDSCEEQLKSFKGTIRCLLEEKKHDSCFACGKQSNGDVLVAKAY